MRTSLWWRRGRVLLLVVALAGALLAAWPGGAPSARAAAGQAATAAQASTAPELNAVSCAPGGTCVAGGTYQYGTGTKEDSQAVVAIGANGTWGQAVEVPGLAALKPKGSEVTAVSCTAGGCVVGGYWYGTKLRDNAFVASERNGTWSNATTVLKPASSVPTFGVGPQVVSVSCQGSENCTVGGGTPAFIVSEKAGRWGKTRTFTKDSPASIHVSCTLAGDCTAGWGTFVDREKNGTWPTPVAVSGLTAKTPSATAEAGITSLSCTSAVNCLAGGVFPSTNKEAAFAVTERNGSWGTAATIPGYAALNQGPGEGIVGAVSCISAGDCVIGGAYTAEADFAGGVYVPFVVSERTYTWSDAIESPGVQQPAPVTPECEPDGSAQCVEGQIFSVACAPGGTCVGGGDYTTTDGGGGVLASLYQQGTWSDPIQIPGLTTGGGEINSVSCTSANVCTVLGDSWAAQEKDGVWSQAQEISGG